MTPVLVDTSVWRQFFRGAPGVRWLRNLLEEEAGVLCHPIISGEMILGGLSEREESLLAVLPRATRVPDEEVLGFVRHRRLERGGIGWIDAHLLASALTSPAVLWTIDKKLAEVASELRIDWRPKD